MSTNKTENLSLHSWVKADPFKLEEINENFSLLDAAVGGHGNCELVFGSYRGSGKSGRDDPVTLTFPGKPLLVLVRPRDYSSYGIRLLALYGCTGVNGGDSARVIPLYTSWTENSLTWYTTVTDTSTSQFYPERCQLNSGGNIYDYVALLAADGE